MIENMTVGRFVEEILAGGIYDNHCRTCDYWHKKGCSHGYVDCYYMQEAMVEQIIKERRQKRKKEVAMPISCIGCPYAREIKP